MVRSPQHGMCQQFVDDYRPSASPRTRTLYLTNKQVSELEDQLERAGRDRLELVACLEDNKHCTFSAALKPECPICQVEVKDAVLDPCRHLAACCTCAKSLSRLVMMKIYGGAEWLQTTSPRIIRGDTEPISLKGSYSLNPQYDIKDASYAACKTVDEYKI